MRIPLDVALRGIMILVEKIAEAMSRDEKSIEMDEGGAEAKAVGEAIDEEKEKE